MALRALANADVADEVAQEAIVRAFHSLRTTRPGNLGAFVAGIARHVIADVIRARPREASLADVAPDAEPRVLFDPLAALCLASEKARVHEALGRLSPDDRALLQLLFFEELSPTEIAARLRAPPERIRQRKLRAIARLRLAFAAGAAAADRRHAGPSGATTGSAIRDALEPLRSRE